MSGPIRISPEALAFEAQTLQRKLSAGLSTLHQLGDTQFGVTPKHAVWSDGKVTLYRYQGEQTPTAKVPVLICYALVNRPYMIDLQHDRSLVKGLLARGEDVYIIDWGYPYAALNGKKIRNLITMVTPVDFHTPDNMLAHWTRSIDVDLFVDALGNVPADLMNSCYLTLKPFRLLQQKYVGLVDILDDVTELENFLRMERWIFDSPDQAGEAFREFIKWFYQGNGFVNGGVQIGGREINLGNIGMPVLNIFAEHDHLVPPSAAKALRTLAGTDDYTELSFRGGHIGIYVSGRAQREVPETIHGWLHVR
jgi:polyhydroxyalkanoate synthase